MIDAEKEPKKDKKKIDWKKVEEDYNRCFSTPISRSGGISDIQTMYTYVLDLNRRLEKLEKQCKR